MAIEYTLRGELRVPESQIGDILTRRCGLTPKEDGEVIAYQGGGLVCYALPESDLGRSIVEETYGLISTIEFRFRLDKFDMYEDGILNMICICCEVMKELVGDCVYLQNGEIPLLLRRGHQVTLEAHDPVWKPKLELIAAEIGEPFAFGPMPRL